jgi:hypothetical protein
VEQLVPGVSEEYLQDDAEDLGLGRHRRDGQEPQGDRVLLELGRVVVHGDGRGAHRVGVEEEDQVEEVVADDDDLEVPLGVRVSGLFVPEVRQN